MSTHYYIDCPDIEVTLMSKDEDWGVCTIKEENGEGHTLPIADFEDKYHLLPYEGE